MKKKICITFFLGIIGYFQAQEIYIVNSLNTIQKVEISTLEVTPLYTVPITEAGFITDLAISPNGTMYGVTNQWTLIEIDVQNQSFETIVQLPIGDTYTNLVCNDQNELFSAKLLSQELFKYNIDTQETTLVTTGISSPGDLTYSEGQLVYPGNLNDFIKAYDGTTITNVGCSIPEIWTFVNDFEECGTNTIYALDRFAKIYEYDLGTKDFILIGDIVSEVGGQVYGGATTTEYMAAACPLVPINTVECIVLNNAEYNPLGIQISSTIITQEFWLDSPYKVPLHITLYDMNGKVLIDNPYHYTTINVSDLSAGIYFLRVSNEEGLSVFEEKIIKK